MLKNCSKKLYTSKIKTKEAEAKIALESSENPRTVSGTRQVCVSAFFFSEPAARMLLLCFYHILTSSVIYY